MLRLPFPQSLRRVKILSVLPVDFFVVRGTQQQQVREGVTFPGGQASLSFNGAALYGASDATAVAGSRGTLRSVGPDLGRQTVRLATAEGVAQPDLKGQWFNDGFAGTMGALLRAIETGEEPIHSARGNLAALRLSQAAIESARTGAPVRLA